MYNKVVNGVRDLGVVKGATGPHIIECDDGKKYVVKFADGTKTSVNEFVGRALAEAIGLPVPAGSLVKLSGDIVAGSSDMAYRAVRPGLHPGSELIEGAMDLDQFARRSAREGVSLSNPEVLPQTICHDNWILTRDRDRSDNHIIRPEDGHFSYTMVDFTHGFTGPQWTPDSIEQGSYLRILMPTHPVVADAVTGLESLSPALDKMESLGDQEVEAVVAGVPDAWGLTAEERTCLVSFLEIRRGLVRSVLTSNRATFPNWRA